MWWNKSDKRMWGQSSLDQLSHLLIAIDRWLRVFKWSILTSYTAPTTLYLFTLTSAFEWCRYRLNWTANDWSRTVFSDESRFEYPIISGYVQDNVGIVARHTDSQPGVMVRDSFSFDSRIRLVVLREFWQHSGTSMIFYAPLCYSFIHGIPGLHFNRIMSSCTLQLSLWITFVLVEHFPATFPDFSLMGHFCGLISRYYRPFQNSWRKFATNSEKKQVLTLNVSAMSDNNLHNGQHLADVFAICNFSLRRNKPINNIHWYNTHRIHRWNVKTAP